MSFSLERVGAVSRADFLIRFRRVSTLVVFLLLSGIAYLWVPPPSTGRGLLVIEGRRAIYNSAAVGMATASLATLFIGLAGFYVISNALRRDISGRCGYVIASTPVGSGEYLLGKFLGNLLFLATFVGGFMLSSMAMLLVRGEAPLQPFVFLSQYLLIVPPSIVLVSVLALVFESIPWLSGKLGDVIYFFVWMGSLGFVAAMTVQGGALGPAAYFDYSGFAYMINQLQSSLGTESISIGASSFNAAKPPFNFHGLTLGREWILPRLGSLLTPLPLLLLARLFFHRFDPVRVHSSVAKGRRNWLRRLDTISKPLTRPLALLTSGRDGDSLVRSAASDAVLTVSSMPLALAGIVTIGIISALAPVEASRGVYLAVFLALGIVIADLPCRERRQGTIGLVFSSPRLRNGFVAWKMIAAVMLAGSFVIPGAVRLALDRPSSLAPLLVGAFFTCAMAVCLGVISRNPKTFLLLFLSFWYIVANDRGESPALDFAGFLGTATAAVTAGYLFAAVSLVGIAEIFHRWRLREEG